MVPWFDWLMFNVKWIAITGSVMRVGGGVSITLNISSCSL